MNGNEIANKLSADVGVVFAVLSPLVFGSDCPIGVNSNETINRKLTKEDQFYLKDFIDCSRSIVKFKPLSEFQIKKRSTISKHLKFLLDSKIIKVVMSHGKIEVNCLCTEVLKVLNGLIPDSFRTPDRIMNRIPNIIERGYIKLSGHDLNFLVYNS